MGLEVSLDQQPPYQCQIVLTFATCAVMNRFAALDEIVPVVRVRTFNVSYYLDTDNDGRFEIAAKPLVDNVAMVSGYVRVCLVCPVATSLLLYIPSLQLKFLTVHSKHGFF